MTHDGTTSSKISKEEFEVRTQKSNQKSKFIEGILKKRRNDDDNQQPPKGS